MALGIEEAIRLSQNRLPVLPGALRASGSRAAGRLGWRQARLPGMREALPSAAPLRSTPGLACRTPEGCKVSGLHTWKASGLQPCKQA